MKNGIALEIFGRHTRKGSSVAHLPYDIYSMVGWSIASISDLGGIFTSAMDLHTVLYTVFYIQYALMK